MRDHLVTLLVAGPRDDRHPALMDLRAARRHPEVLARAREGDPAYLDAVVQEGQRTRPVLTFAMRTLKAPMEVGGHDVPAGATLGTSVLLLHSRPDLFPDPYAFRPERFVGAKPETYSWIPFGGGVRRCLGASFAQFEMRQVLDARCSRGASCAPPTSGPSGAAGAASPRCRPAARGSSAQPL